MTLYASRLKTFLSDCSVLIEGCTWQQIQETLKYRGEEVYITASSRHECDTILMVLYQIWKHKVLFQYLNHSSISQHACNKKTAITFGVILGMWSSSATQTVITGMDLCMVERLGWELRWKRLFDKHQFLCSWFWHLFFYLIVSRFPILRNYQWYGHLHHVVIEEVVK